MSKNQDYRFSFTVGGLFLHEAMALADAWQMHRDWQVVRHAVPDNLFISSGMPSSAARLRNEAIRRLSHLDEVELEHLADCPASDARALCWVAACREYRFMLDFAWQVLVEKHNPYAEPVRYADFDILLDGLEATNADLSPVKASTRLRLRSVLFRILHEAELIDGEGRVLTLPISPKLREILGRQKTGGLDCIPGEQ